MGLVLWDTDRDNALSSVSVVSNDFLIKRFKPERVRHAFQQKIKQPVGGVNIPGCFFKYLNFYLLVTITRLGET